MILEFIKSQIKAILPRYYLIRVKEIYLKSRSLFYIGNSFFCPCCEGNFRKFLALKEYPDLQVLCPNCESLERHRLLWMYLKEKTNIISGNIRLLHISPEFFFLKVLGSMSNIDYISVDLRSPYANAKMDIMKIDYEANSFDAVLCNHVLEHVEDDKKALCEIFRVLKPGGWAILQSPIDNNREKTFEISGVVLGEDRKRLFGQVDHVRIYGRDYGTRLTDCGFIVNIDTYARGLGNDKIAKYKLRQDMNIYFCTKPTFGGDTAQIR